MLAVNEGSLARLLVHLQHPLECYLGRGGKEVNEKSLATHSSGNSRNLLSEWILFTDIAKSPWPMCCHLRLSFLVHSSTSSATLFWSSMLTAWAYKLTLISTRSCDSKGEKQTESPASALIKKLTASFFSSLPLAFPLPASPTSCSLPFSAHKSPIGYILFLLLC